MQLIGFSSLGMGWGKDTGVTSGVFLAAVKGKVPCVAIAEHWAFYGFEEVASITKIREVFIVFLWAEEDCCEHLILK